MGIIHQNLNHDSISHNRGYSQSKTKNLAFTDVESRDMNIQFKHHEQKQNLGTITTKQREKDNKFEFQ